MVVDCPLTDKQLQAIATSMAACNDALSRLVRLLQQVRALQLDELRLLLRERSDHIVRQVNALDYEISYVICLTLREAGLMTGNNIQLPRLENYCLEQSCEIGHSKAEPED